ncbi:MAG: hypothetical protein RL154_369 [Pseudomonadota bacterium]|jgi:AmmeMemoRadiSam system protein B
MSVRPSAVAGVFYPSDTDALSSMIDGFLQKTINCFKVPKILIAPHAGYMYSGLVAASAYKQLENLDQNKKYRVLLIGTSHRVYFHGVAFSSFSAFETPLGVVDVDVAKEQAFINSSPFAFFNDEAHAYEHSLETQLPFLQKSLKNFSIIPAVYSDCDMLEIEATLDYFLQDEDTIAIISADLSHFNDYETAQKMDLETIDMIENGYVIELVHEQTCGKNGICAVVNYAKRHSLKEKTLDYKNSGDITNDKTKVVGYMSAIFYMEH